MASSLTTISKTNTTEERESQDDSHVSLESIISTLPSEKGWRTGSLHQYQGFWHHDDFLLSIISLQRHFNPTPSHVILATYPKSGTTWLSALTFAIFHRHHPHRTHPLLTTNPHSLVPILELYAMDNLRNPNPPVPLVATHIPFTSLPQSVFDSKCRIVYAWRDPKDVLVSLWHFTCKLRRKDLPPPLTLEEASEMFAREVSPFGPYWKHLLGYWNARLDHSETMMFVRYEDLKRDPVFHTKRLAMFLGRAFSLEEERDGVVDEIIELCSFAKLSNLEVNKSGMLQDDPPIPNSAFFRKGEEGDSKNHLSVEMMERLDRITEEKLKGSGLTL